ncbi:MAG: polysaccharide biosynthesis tyrosine autokinase, partial [Apibacter sp.]
MHTSNLQSINQNKNQKNKNSDFLENNFFSFERFIRRLIKNWYWFLIAFIFGWTIAFLVNRFSDRFFQSSTTVSISSGTSSVLAPNQSINFIWGGNNGATQGIYYKKLLSSRTHNENLVKSLDLYINYYLKGNIKTTEIDYVDIPYKIVIDTNYAQALYTDVKVDVLPNKKFKLTFPDNLNENCFLYTNESYYARKDKYKKELIVPLNTWIKTNNLKFKFVKNNEYEGRFGDNVTDLSFYFYLSTINNAVSKIKSLVSIDFDKDLPSIMIITKKGLSLNGTINFLNKSVDDLIKKRLDDKNKVNLNTIEFIKNQLIITKRKLDSATAIFQRVQLDNKIFSKADVSTTVLLSKIQSLDIQREELKSKIEAVNQLKKSTFNKNFYLDGDILGISDKNLDELIQNVQSFEQEKKDLLLIYRENSEPISEINYKINNAKNKVASILDNSSKDLFNNLKNVNNQISNLELDIETLPEKERLFVNAQRGYLLNDGIYNTLLDKLSEAEMRKATTISDITVLDKAKNTGQAPITPNIKQNKYKFIGISLVIPLILLFLIELLDNKIKLISDLKSITKIPIIGTIGPKNTENNLAVLARPKSSISESFRAIRSNLRFLYNEKDIKGGKVFLITSSIGSEGKTFIAINLASVLALSGKRTVLVGMDLRKPRIFDDFKISNKVGLSGYLSGANSLDEIIKKTEYDNLDIITAGPIPPNPGELLISPENEQLIKILRDLYDYIIIDSPPVGLVIDAYDLISLSDARIYVTRCNYTYKQLLKGINEK